MSDNITLNSGSGGATLATDDIGGVHYQLVKLGYGALDAVTVVSAANPLPVADVGITGLPADTFVADGGALGKGVLIQGDDGTDRHNLAVDEDGVLRSRLACDAILDGAAKLTPQFAKIECAASGDNQLINTTAGKKVRVVSLALFASGAVEVYFKSEGGTVIFGGSTTKLKLDHTGAVGAAGFVLAFNPVGWFQTDVDGEDLEINLSAAVGVCGAITYLEVD